MLPELALPDKSVRRGSCVCCKTRLWWIGWICRRTPARWQRQGWRTIQLDTNRGDHWGRYRESIYAGSILRLVEAYGVALFDLPGKLKQALADHAHKFLERVQNED